MLQTFNTANKMNDKNCTSKLSVLTSVSREVPIWKAAEGFEHFALSNAISNIARSGFSTLHSSDVRIKSKCSARPKSK